MHIPDGFLDAPTSVATGVLAVGGLAYCVKRAQGELDDKLAPMAGLTAAFVFAVQMLNFPVALGTSGHLLGGLLAAVLVGPAAGAMCLAVVLLVQALFADGGLTALGANITVMGLVTAFGGYAVFLLLMRLLPKRDGTLVLSAGIAAGVSVVLSAASFVLLFAFGGNVDLSLTGVLAAMVGVHTLIGIGEGLITAVTVGTVLKTRPDLVYAARGLLPKKELVLHSGAPTVPGVSA
ncbi:MAG TPA: energy-coupling factor ABC transporter permease [Mycobacteriales bacterium]|nr:energy-coupling factor ABC transporter permease [Mycobacteriales bacterium]